MSNDNRTETLEDYLGIYLNALMGDRVADKRMRLALDPEMLKLYGQQMKMIGWFMGQLFKRCPNVNPEIARRILVTKLLEL